MSDEPEELESSVKLCHDCIGKQNYIYIKSREWEKLSYHVYQSKMQELHVKYPICTTCDENIKRQLRKHTNPMLVNLFYVHLYLFVYM